MSQISAEHRASAPQEVCCAVVTVSDSRTLETDSGGQLLCELLTQAGFQVAARDAAKASRAGGLVTLGAHGQLQGLGAHWELWALAGEGAMTPMEALRAATLNGATYLGLDKQIGSVEPGKLADLVVLDANPLEDIHNSVKIGFVVKNGEVWE